MVKLADTDGRLTSTTSSRHCVCVRVTSKNGCKANSAHAFVLASVRGSVQRCRLFSGRRMMSIRYESMPVRLCNVTGGIFVCIIEINKAGHVGAMELFPALFRT